VMVIAPAPETHMFDTPTLRGARRVGRDSVRLWVVLVNGEG